MEDIGVSQNFVNNLRTIVSNGSIFYLLDTGHRNIELNGTFVIL